MARGDLILRIGADDSPLRATLKKLNNDLVRTGNKLESIGQSLSLRLSAPIVAAGAASVKTFAQFDKLEKGLAAITGSADEARKQFGTLLDVVKDTRTTLDLRTAATASLQLQAVGRDARGVENTLRQLSIAATLSGSSSDDVGEVARQFSQAAAKGKILQQELRIILERIPALAGVINEEFGTVTAEGLRDAGVSADEFITRLTRAIEQNQKFQNVQGGLSKAIETFGINVQIAGAELGKTISETIGLESALDSISNTISSVVEGFSSLSPSTKAVILGITGLAAAIGPFLAATGVLLKTLPLIRAGFAALTGPVGLLALAIGALTIAIIGEYTEVSAAEVAQRRLNGLISEAEKAVNDEKEAVSKLTSVIESETSSKGEKARAIEQLKRISPEYFGQLDVEKTKTEDLTQAVDAYAASLRNVKIEKLNQDSLEAQERLEAVNKQLEIANATIKQTAGQFGTGVGFGVNQAADRLEREKEELEATIALLAKETNQAVIDAQTQVSGITSGSTAPTITQSIETRVSQPKINPLEGIGQNASSIAAVLQETDRNINLVNNSLSETERLAQTGFAKLISDDFKELSANIQTTTNPLTQLSTVFGSLQDQSIVFGEGFDLLTEKINATKAAIQSALEEGFSPTSNTVLALTEIMGGLTSQLEAQQAAIDSNKKAISTYTAIFNSAASSQVKSLGDVGKAALSAAAKVIKAKIQEATVNFIADSFAKFGIFGAIAAAGAGAIVGGLVSKAFGALNIPALAEGGLVTGPTLALIGEGRENEVVLPLSKLNNLINTGQPQERLLATVGIDEIYVALERYKRENGRVN